MARKAHSKGNKARSIRKKSSSTEVVYHSTKEIKVERELIENFIGLQKVMLTLSAKFEGLSGQISRLLDLFEVSAKALAKKEFVSSGDIDAKRIMEKLDNLSQQAGLIGRGLALIHEVRKEEPTRSTAISPPVPKRTYQILQEKPAENLGGFEKSMASRNNKSEENTNAAANI